MALGIVSITLKKTILFMCVRNNKWREIGRGCVGPYRRHPPVDSVPDLSRSTSGYARPSLTEKAFEDGDVKKNC